MPRTPNKKPTITPELQEVIDRLRENVKFAERKGQYDSCHHEQLARILKSLEQPQEAAKEQNDGE